MSDDIPTDAELDAEIAAMKAESDEWDAIIKKYYPGHKIGEFKFTLYPKKKEPHIKIWLTEAVE